jgi:hypothetical protein
VLQSGCEQDIVEAESYVLAAEHYLEVYRSFAVIHDTGVVAKQDIGAFTRAQLLEPRAMRAHMRARTGVRNDAAVLTQSA